MFELFHYFNFQLHATLIGIYQNFQGGANAPPHPPQIKPCELRIMVVARLLHGC